MSAEADAVCGAEYGSRSQDRNGYRRRDFDTRTGNLDVAIPKLRSGRISRTGCWSVGAGRSRADHSGGDLTTS